MSVNDAYTDVVELCALLQCLGFSVKSLETTDANLSHDVGARTVVINCQSSGLHVVLESAGLACSCPTPSHQNSGMWLVSGVTGGKQLDKEFGCTLLGSLPKAHRERLTKELREMIKCIKQHNESDLEKPRAKETTINKSVSMIELNTPEKSHAMNVQRITDQSLFAEMFSPEPCGRLQVERGRELLEYLQRKFKENPLLFQAKVDTPTRYRSLDTLTTKGEEQQLPAPGLLTKRLLKNYGEDNNDQKTSMCRRQSTYTLSSETGSMRRRNKTSSPIQSSHNTLLDNLIEAEREAESLRSKLAFVIRELVDEGKDSSISSLVLDVSKISLLKGEPSKAQFASSPNLSGMGAIHEDFQKIHLKRFESASTSNLGPKKITSSEKPSRLRRISPNIFSKMKKESSSAKPDKVKPQEVKSASKFNSLFKPKVVTPLHVSRPQSPNISATKKKFSHIKSTIPRPTPVKKD